MTFLNPLVLIGLLAASIPLILHLLNLRKLKKVEFSTLTFLKELQQSKIRRLKLRQFLLLLIRTLLIIMVVLGFAQPTIHGDFLSGLSSQAKSTSIFLLDDSFSMSARNEKGELFTQAKETISQLIDLLQPGDEAILLKFSEVSQSKNITGMTNFGPLQTLLTESKVSFIRKPIEEVLQNTVNIIENSKNPNKEIFVLSDFQQTLFSSNLSSNELKLDSRTKLFAIEYTSSSMNNVAIETVDVVTKIIEKNKPIKISVRIKNYSQNPINNYVVSTFLENVRVAQQNVSIPAWGSNTIMMTFAPKQSGTIKGYVELEPDVIDADNRWYFTFDVLENIPVLIVADDTTEAKYLSLALRPSKSQEDCFIKIVTSSTQKFLTIDLDTFKNILLITSGTLPVQMIQKLQRFISDGKGLILFPSKKFNHIDFNKHFGPSLKLPKVENIFNTGNNTGLNFSKIDFEHPIFYTVFETNFKKSNEVIQSPNITTTLSYSIGKLGHSIISLDNGQSFLTEYTFGRGRILMFSIALDLKWSDFPFKAIFVPLIYRSVQFTSSNNQSEIATVGHSEPIIIRSSAHLPQKDSYTLVSPDGFEEKITPTHLRLLEETKSEQYSITPTGRIYFQLKPFTIPGFYEIRKGSTLLKTIAVNIDPKESDLRKSEPEQFYNFWKTIGVRPESIQKLEQGSKIKETIYESRLGAELSRYCFAFALLLALVEMLIARNSRKERVELTQVKNI